MPKLKISFPSYQQPSLVTFGTGSIKVLMECGDLTDTAILISGQDTVMTVVERCLRKRGYPLDEVYMLSKPAGEPTSDMIQLGAAFLQERSWNRIMGIGGGSVMDWCRLAWAESESLLSYSAGKVELKGTIERRPEFWLIPTICGTGAEASSVAVFSANGRKIPVVSRAFLADRVVLDGQFLAHVNPSGLANSLCDALSHAIEAFVSIVPCYLAKEIAIASLHLILEAYHKEASVSRHDRLMEAGYLGGVAASNCSVGAIHAFAHTMATYGVTHGHANALGLIAGIYANQDTPGMQALFRRCGMGSPEQFAACLRPIVQAAISPPEDGKLLAILRDDSLRGTIKTQMAADGCMRSNPQPLNDYDLHQFLDRVIETVENI
jgi:alcohol dehydrogenase class IV